MKENTKFYLVKNRSAGQVFYSVPDMNIRRHFAPGEMIKVSYEELLKLSNQPGGKSLMVNFLQIEEEKILKDFNISVQPEYFMNEQQVKDLLISGSLDAFLDCLDYAPAGVIDLVKELAIKIPLANYDKKDALKEKLGFNVDKILENKKAEEEEAKNPGGFVAETKTAEKTTTSTRPATRRTNVNYKKTEDTVK